ncbi:MAG: hypothetical protein IMY71_01220 [Bacteroidetes bacterium]|nr:hypothetical protein [Bacteroidota bacterium]
MPTNLLKKYPELLEIMHLSEHQRTKSLRGVFNRDIQNNPGFKFRSKQIRPIFIDGEASMGNLFNHLTREEVEVVKPDGTTFNKRIFEKDRSMRLHWIKFHIDECKKNNVEVFSIIERNTKKRKNVTLTYIYDLEQQYVIVMEPQNSNRDYYLLSAHYLNKDYGPKKMKKKLKKKLPYVY